MNNQESIFTPADILLPVGKDYEKWAVVACDQFTSQPEYWERVEEFAGNEPSTYNLILPESKFLSGDFKSLIKEINSKMYEYLDSEIFTEFKDAMIYLERTQKDGRVRKGIIGKIDLKAYDFNPDAEVLVRATEGTIIERIPPRQDIRRNAPLELPHAMLLVDDPENAMFAGLDTCDEVIYDFDLMENGGHAKGYLIPDELKTNITEFVKSLMTKPMAFAVGDGNHSLAAAKSLYMEEAAKVSPEEADKLPSRYALIEVVNLYDSALDFEPIHRLIKNVDYKALLDAFKAEYPGAYEGKGEGHVIGYSHIDGEGFITIPAPQYKLAVATLQTFLDEYLEANDGEIDYIHGDEITMQLGKGEGCLSFLLPPLDKHDLFKSIAADGPTPRKTFSMGHAEDKRYYNEARRIK